MQNSIMIIVLPLQLHLQISQISIKITLKFIRVGGEFETDRLDADIVFVVGLHNLEKVE